jgi:hypothetical protein
MGHVAATVAAVVAAVAAVVVAAAAAAVATAVAAVAARGKTPRGGQVILCTFGKDSLVS